MDANRRDQSFRDQSIKAAPTDRRAANRRFALSLAFVAGVMLALTLATGVAIHLADISAFIL